MHLFSRSLLATLALLLTGAAPAAALTPFKGKLPIPPVAKPTAPGEYRMNIVPLKQRLHPDLPLTDVWGYSDGTSPASWPGPIIASQRGETVKVTWVNGLPSTGHLLPFHDPSGHGAAVPRMLTHLHGAFVAGASDGNPYASADVMPGGSQKTTYTNGQPSTALFYHDHAHGITRLNVYAGLAGPYLIRDDTDTGTGDNPAGLPAGKYELPLVLQDRSLTPGGQLLYTAMPMWVPEFFGDLPVVNGAIQPYTDVEPRRYRLRLVNGSNSRFYNLAFGGLKFHQVGADGGLFDKPVLLRRLLLMPGERADVVVDFASSAGSNVQLKDSALPAGVVSPARSLPGAMMRFRVGTKVANPDRGPLPTVLGGEQASLDTPSVTRDITLEEQLDPATGAPTRLLIDGKPFTDPVDIKAKKDAIEDWRFVNLSADTHPMHMHLQQFQVVDRRPFDVADYQAALDAFRAGAGPRPTLSEYWTGPAVAPRPGERGWKDTAGADPGEVLRVRARFTLPENATGTQKFVLHCHILEHEDNDMMRPFEVR